MIAKYLTFAILLQLSVAIPLPVIITRVHTAAPVTVTVPYTTGTTTINLPPVELFISNGVTYTKTDGQPAGDAPAPAPTPDTPAPAPAPAATTNAPAPPPPAATNTPAPAPAPAAPTSNSPAPAPAPASTNTPAAPAPAPTSSTQTPAPAPAPASSPDNSPAPAPASSSPAASNSPAQVQAPTTLSTQTTTSQQQTTTSSSAPSPQSNSAPSPSSSSSGGGISAPDSIVYSPYQDDGSCKSSDTINSDLQLIKSKGINKVRIYGTDCGNWDTIMPTCAKLGLKVNQGFWISNQGVDSIDADISAFISYGQSSGWDVFDFITVGNEAVSAGYCSAGQLTSKIQSVKSQVKGAGYNGKITTSEPPASFIDNPSLCTQSGIDFVGVNAHSYFDPSSTAGDSGPFVVGQKQQVINACNGMSAYITETGYPSKGDSNGGQVPSPENQASAIQSIMQATGGDICILTTYNDFWKAPGPHGIEQYFGSITLFN